MKNMINQELKALFAEFEKAISALDFEAIGGLFADCVISAGPSGIAVRSRAEFVEGTRKVSEFYRSIGQKALKIESLDETTISDQYSLFTVRWGQRFKKQATC